MLISPATSIPLPKDTEKALKDAYNNVTLAEAEYRRLVELRVAEESNIVELGKRKAYEKELLDDVSDKLAKAQEKLVENEALIRSQTSKIDLQQQLLSENDKVLAESEKDAKKREKELKEKEDTLALNWASYEAHKKQLDENIATHNKKVKILSDALKQL